MLGQFFMGGLCKQNLIVTVIPPQTQFIEDFLWEGGIMSKNFLFFGGDYSVKNCKVARKNF